MLNFKEVKKSFANTEVLKSVSLEVPTGKTVVLLGPSGSGKTTLLRCGNYLEVPDGGTVTLNDLSINSKNHDRRVVQQLRQRCTMVFQQYNLFKNMTVLENVMLGLTLAQGKAKAEAREIAVDYLERVGLADRIDYYPVQLSGGQQQRVGIARAIALKPEVILFDEPTAALDPELIGEVLAVMRKIAKAGMTMLVVTHEMNFARDVADEVVFMADGLVVERGRPADIFDHPQSERTQQFLRNVRH